MFIEDMFPMVLNYSLFIGLTDAVPNPLLISCANVGTAYIYCGSAASGLLIELKFSSVSCEPVIVAAPLTGVYLRSYSAREADLGFCCSICGKLNPYPRVGVKLFALAFCIGCR
jgi:hypothetical protein